MKLFKYLTLIIVIAVLFTIVSNVQNNLKFQSIYKSIKIQKDLKDIYGKEQIKFNRDNVRLVLKLLNRYIGINYDKPFTNKVYDKMYKSKYIEFKQIYQITYYCMRSKNE